MLKMDSLPKKKNYKSAALVLSSSLVLFGGTGYFLKNAWWADEATSFHFDDGADLKYALNLDKASHAFGGAIVADLYTKAFIGANMPIHKATWYGTGMGILGQMAIEIKDGFAPRWGFSVWDVLSGSAGAFYNMGKYHSNFLANTDLKVSYWQRSTKYFEKSNKRAKAFSIDDYLNQTYWFTIYPKAVFNSKTKPDWLGLSIGNGIEPDFWDGAGLGRHELYIAPDISLERLFKPKKKFFKQILHFADYIKVPMPTLQVYPQTKLWWFFL
jgi:hypothetical protein